MKNYKSKFCQFLLAGLIFTSLEVNASAGKPGEPAAHKIDSSLDTVPTKTTDSSIDDFGREFDNLFYSLNKNFFSHRNNFYSSSLPPLNIYENKETFFIEAELAGVSKEDIELKTGNNILVIKISRDREVKETEIEYFVRERRTGSYQRSISLPTYLDLDSIITSFKNNVLKIEFKRKKDTEFKIIDIKS